MPSTEFHILLTILILAFGAGIFLRVVGKEKHRRENWLQFRLDEKIKELKQAQAQTSSHNIDAAPIDNA